MFVALIKGLINGFIKGFIKGFICMSTHVKNGSMHVHEYMCIYMTIKNPCLMLDTAL